MKYQPEDIFIGDEVYFSSTSTQTNHDLYWKVRGKKNQQIYVELDLDHKTEYWTINISDVQYLTPLSKDRPKE